MVTRQGWLTPEMRAGLVLTEQASRRRKVCADCGGLGEIFGYRNVEDGPMDATVWPCVECDGSGYVEVSK